MRRFAVALCALAIGLAACGGGDDGATPTTRPSSTASVAITSPSNGDEVAGPDVTVTVALTGGRIVDVVTKDLTPDEGHLHFSLDGKVVESNGDLEYVLRGVAPGAHVVTAEFVAADHVFFSPRVTTSVTFTVG